MESEDVVPPVLPPVVPAVPPDVVPVEEPLTAFAAYGVPAVTGVASGAFLLDTPVLLGKALAQLAGEETAARGIPPR